MYPEKNKGGNWRADIPGTRIMRKLIAFLLLVTLLCGLAVESSAAAGGLVKENQLYYIRYTGIQNNTKEPSVTWVPDIYPGHKYIYINQGRTLEVPVNVYLYINPYDHTVWWVSDIYRVRDVKIHIDSAPNRTRLWVSTDKKKFREDGIQQTHNDLPAYLEWNADENTLLFYVENADGAKEYFKTLKVLNIETQDNKKYEGFRAMDMDDGKVYDFTKIDE